MMTTPVFLSSGDLLADRRAEYAEALCHDDPAAACDLYLQALDRVPGWAAGWFRLGEIRAEARLDGAAEAFERAIAADPGDRLGAGLRRDLLRKRTLGADMPSAFVETLFDQYADRFDAALVGALDYRAPAQLAAGLRAPLGRVLDLGCGTGLMGQELRAGAAWLEGWDISAGMLREAGAKAVYDALHRRDLSVLEPVGPTWDLITAADVFIYLGSLEQIVGWVALALFPGGRFAFTVELHEGDEAWVLRESRRFAHSLPYVTELLAQAGFSCTATRAVLRRDAGQPVTGLLVHAELTRRGDARPDEAGRDVARVDG